MDKLSHARVKLAELMIFAADLLTKNLSIDEKDSRFVDLAPTDKADKSGVYAEALTEATTNPRVMNIALTGPYGSGKSSIIKSFLTRYKRPVLQISLAAFMPENDPIDAGPGRQEIERSILQQMLYGPDANRLPLSRFKRIQSPGRWSRIASLSIIVGTFAVWYLIEKREAIITGAFFRPFDTTNWYNFLALLIGGIFIWRLFHHVYVASFGISLKSISLKDIEIAPKAATEESILNRHLDEIIYFFQSTKYDLVVVEDLDRFNNPDIFVTLREINGLVNANAGVTRRVRFLYALRDDMFINTERTKFFEFIVPVIPIINSSNSIDKVLEQGRRLSLEARLNPQFIREVSRYLDDLRLIQNIFNEYAIYFANLEPKGETNLDANKLLAVLIYKNLFPSDFENLHRGKGYLADIFQSHGRLLAASEAQYNAEISHLEEIINISESNLAQNIDELRKIYAMALIELIPEGYTYVSLDHNTAISLSSLTKHDKFDSIITSSHIFARNMQGYFTGLSISGLQGTVSQSTLYLDRKQQIAQKSSKFRDDTAKRINELRSEISNLRMLKFSDMLRKNTDVMTGLFDGFGDKADLARFLVLEGYLDDSYYQYTSLFHSGRLSPSDNKFLIRIRGFNNPDPNFQIDNPREVVAAMRDEDFSRNYVLNVNIVDYLLANISPHTGHVDHLFSYVASDFDECQEFIKAYYDRGAGVKEFINGLARAWPDFINALLASSANLTHVAQIVRHLTDAELKSSAIRFSGLAQFISNNLVGILDQGVDFPPERLKLIGVEAIELSAISAYPGVVQVLFEGGLYAVSIENLNFIFRSILAIEDEHGPARRNFTLVLESGSEPLLEKVNQRFDLYLDNVLLELPENQCESLEAVRKIVAREDIEIDQQVRFLERQSIALPNLDGVPDRLHVPLFEIGKIEPSWQNCHAFLQSERYDTGVLTNFLNDDVTIRVLREHPIPDQSEYQSLSEFIFENDSLSDEAYSAYTPSLSLMFDTFPDAVSNEKMKILIDRGIVKFTVDNLQNLIGDPVLGVDFVKKKYR